MLFLLYFIFKITIRYHTTSMFCGFLYGEGGDGVINCVAIFFHRNVLNCSGCGAFFDRKIPQRVCVPGRSDV